MSLLKSISRLTRMSLLKSISRLMRMSQLKSISLLKHIKPIDIIFCVLIISAELLFSYIRTLGDFHILYGIVFGIAAGYSMGQGLRVLPIVIIMSALSHLLTLNSTMSFTPISSQVFFVIYFTAISGINSFLLGKYFYPKMGVDKVYTSNLMKVISLNLITFITFVPAAVISCYLLLTYSDVSSHAVPYFVLRQLVGVFLAINLLAPSLCIAFYFHDKNIKRFYQLHHIAILFVFMISITGSILYLEWANKKQVQKRFDSSVINMSQRNSELITCLIDQLNRLRNSVVIRANLPFDEIYNAFANDNKKLAFADSLLLANESNAINSGDENSYALKYTINQIRPVQSKDNYIQNLVGKEITLDSNFLISNSAFFIPGSYFSNNPKAADKVFVFVQKPNRRGIYKKMVLMGFEINFNRLFDNNLSNLKKTEPKLASILGQVYNYNIHFDNTDFKRVIFQRNIENQIPPPAHPFLNKAEATVYNFKLQQNSSLPSVSIYEISDKSYWGLLLTILLANYLLGLFLLYVLRRDYKLNAVVEKLEEEIGLKMLSQQKVNILNKSLEMQVELRTQLLAERTFELETIFKIFPDILLRVTANGVITYVETLGKSDADLSQSLKVGGSLIQHFTENNSQNCQFAIQNAIRNNHISSFKSYMRFGGNTYYMDLRFFKYSDGVAFCVIRDLTEKEILERQIEEQNIRALNNARLASLGEMAAGIAHEINNPLAIIDGTAEVMQQLINKNPNLKTTKFLNYIETIKKTTRRVSTIIKGLRKYARDKETEFELVKISTLLDESLSFCRARFSNFGVKLYVNNYVGDSLIYCSPVELSQVLINLLNNAFDAVQNLPEKWVSINIEAADDTFIFRVCDSGKGIPCRIVDKIMQPFFTTKDVGSGTGLGLSISLGIVRNHHGELTVNTDYANTCFQFTIPKPECLQKTTATGALA